MCHLFINLKYMANKIVTFVATKYKDKKTNVSFYTEDGKRVNSSAVKRVPTKQKVSFTANVR